jgi:hypothetical protein
MLLGTAESDLAIGTYRIKPVLGKQQWSIEGPGIKPGVRFSVDLSESRADPWTLSYPEQLTLTVSAGSTEEPKAYGDMIDPHTQQFKDPLWLYEGWSGNSGPPQPVAGVDDYETIGLDKPSVTPTADGPKPAAPLYRVKYRDETEKTFTYAELTPKMRAQLQPIFQKADEEFQLFTLQTFPMWWSIVSYTPLAPMPAAGARPYIPGRVPLAPAEPVAVAPAAEGVAGVGPPLQPPAAGRVAELPAGPPQSEQQPGPAVSPVPPESVVVPLRIAPEGPGVAYGQEAATRLAAQGKTGAAILRPLTNELNGQTTMSPMDKATAMQTACNAQKQFGAGPIAKMPNGDLVVTSRAPLPNAPVIIVKADGTVTRGIADITMTDGNQAFQVSNVRITP